MSYQTTNPTGAKELLDSGQGHVYIDVRTVEEFEQGHVPGAYNIPILFRSACGMEPNPDFARVIAHHFGKDARIVFG